MISRQTIDRIFETARIEEVVGDFVALKKRGTNLIGVCPFHNEKTPSFNVNPVRNIFKCFGCGKGGNAVNFLMEHEKLSYPEALRNLAERYKIEIEETASDPRDQQINDERESLLILNSFALKTFSEQLTQSEEGKSIGLTYFRERGFTDETIAKFQLGYSLDEWSAFCETAVKAGYKEVYLERTGLCFRTDKGRLLDRFRGRVMFPIHNLSGRIIGFGGRILKKDDKTAKYLNSPDSEIYHKNKSLYGIFHAKKAILQKNVCYLVEGYTDVISLHQAGVENVVASSGTSLTIEQVRTMARYTKQVIVLYDGDSAGIKAAERGIDMILEEGMTVKVVLFPNGEDPDSFARKHSADEVIEFIESSAKDFVVFRTRQLMGEAHNDPILKAEVIRKVVTTIAKIPDQILQATYTKQCSSLMDISETILLNELNKLRRQKVRKETPVNDLEEILPETIRPNQPATEQTSEDQERNIIRLLLHFGHQSFINYDLLDATEETSSEPNEDYVAGYLVREIAGDNIRFEHPVYDQILSLYAAQPKEKPYLENNFFLHHEDATLRETAIDLLSSRYQLSENWDAMHGIRVPLEENDLQSALSKSVLHLKKKKVMRLLEDNRQKIKEAEENGSDIISFLEEHIRLERLKTTISKYLGIDILR